jgi:class I fructose-bisphosphate aldolase
VKIAGISDGLGTVAVILILKVNNKDGLRDEEDPTQALTASAQEALRLCCRAAGFTIYPGSERQLEMYRQLRAYAEDARRNEPAVAIWSYSRGSSLKKSGESAIDVVGYGVQIAAQLTALVIKVKLLAAPVERHVVQKNVQGAAHSPHQRKVRFDYWP